MFEPEEKGLGKRLRKVWRPVGSGCAEEVEGLSVVPVNAVELAARDLTKRCERTSYVVSRRPDPVTGPAEPRACVVDGELLPGFLPAADDIGLREPL